MKCSLPFRSPSTQIATINNKKAARTGAAAAILFSALMCLAQDQPPSNAQPGTTPQQTQLASNAVQVVIPAGTRLALVLTQPIQTRFLRRGDDIYAQINAPVGSGNQVVIPIGTFVQGKLDKLERRAGRGELRLESMSVTFPDGYVIPLSGPATLVTNEGYALPDPGPGRSIGAFALPAAGIGLGALIGHSVGSSQSIQTTTLPPGCTGPPPYCTSSSMTVPGSKFKDTAIGASIGGVIGAIGSIALLINPHRLLLAAGTPLEMTLEQAVSLKQAEVTAAVQQEGQHPVPEQSVAPLPQPPPPATPVDHGTCWTPGTPGTPPTIIPGGVYPDGTVGPPTIIPGAPPTPGTPYPCP
ncbi:MAG: hypothetical protein ACLQBK_04200 [Candidatus Sulfotelmatobacter sp.]